MRGRLAFGLVFASLCALLVAAVVEPSFLPTNDGPHHVFGAYARAHLEDPALDYARFFDPNVPTTANGFAEIFALLEPALGWQRAHAWTLAVIVLVWAAGSLAFVTALEPRRRWLALVVAALALGWPLYLGFFSFVLGGGLALLVLAATLRLGHRARTRVILAAAVALIATVHFLMAALCGAFVLAARLAVVDKGARFRELILVILTGLPAVLVVLRATGAAASLGDETTVVPWSLRLAALGACTLGGPWWRTLPLIILVVAAALLLARRARSPLERALGGTAVLLCLTPLWLPWHVLGWQHAAVRPLPLAAAVLVALVPVERWSRAARAALATACALFALGATWWARDLGLRAAREIDDVLAAAAAPVPRPAGYRWAFFLSSLPVEKDAGLLRWDPQRGLGSLFALTQGGFVAYSHVVSPQAHTVLLKDEQARELAPPPVRSREVTPLRALDDDGRRRALLESLVSKAVQVDGVIVAERPADHEVWRRRGFTVDGEVGRVLLARFTGCSLKVEVEAAAEAEAEREVTTTPAPIVPGALARTDVVPAGGAILERLPCGLVEVKGCAPATVELSPSVIPVVRCP